MNGDTGAHITEAARWLARERSGAMSEAERAARAAWLAADPEHRAAMAAAEQMLEGLGRHADAPAIHRLREEAVARLADAIPANRAVQRMAIAASVVLALACLPLLTAHLGQGRESQALVAGGDVVTYRTLVGERSSIALPDGSELTMNTASRVRVAFTASERRVELLEGEALFDVARAPERPFVVLAGNRRITAVGTSFGVRLPVDGADLNVTMLEGHVIVDPVGWTAGFDAPPPREELRAGDQLVVTAAGIARVQPANLARATAWRDGRLVFDNADLADLVREANRYSATKLVVADAALARLKVGGVFRAGNPAGIADALAAYFPIDHRQQDGRILLLPRR